MCITNIFKFMTYKFPLNYMTEWLVHSAVHYEIAFKDVLLFLQ